MHPGILKAGAFLLISTDVVGYAMVPNGRAVELCHQAYEKCVTSYDQAHLDQLLEEMFPTMGTFLNEANVDLENRIELFWTKSKYRRLLKVKHEVDPSGLF